MPPPTGLHWPFLILLHHTYFPVVLFCDRHGGTLSRPQVGKEELTHYSTVPSGSTTYLSRQLIPWWKVGHEPVSPSYHGFPLMDGFCPKAPWGCLKYCQLTWHMEMLLPQDLFLLAFFTQTTSYHPSLGWIRSYLCIYVPFSMEASLVESFSCYTAAVCMWNVHHRLMSLNTCFSGWHYWGGCETFRKQGLTAESWLVGC